MRPQLGCTLVFFCLGRARCPPAASPARQSANGGQGEPPHAGAIADRHLSTHHRCRRSVLTKSLRPYLGAFYRCRFQQHSEFLPPIRAAMSVARTCSLNREAKGSVITIRSNCCSISLREEMSNRVPTISCLPASPSHGPCSSKVELPEDQVNRWAAPSRERMASEREGSAAADEQSPRRGRLLITLVDARVTCGHDRHRDRGRGGCPCQCRGRWGRTRQPRPPSRCVARLRGIRLLRLGRGLRWLFAFEHHAFGLVVPACAGVIALADAAAEHLARQRSFQLAADQALEFTRTELGLVAFFREMVDQRLIESERHATGWRRCAPRDRAAGRRCGGSPPCPAHGRR